MIRQNLPARTESMTPQAAIDAGAVALFGEKYGDEVRVLTLGHALVGEGAYSVELCGGTHVARTGDIALFKIIAGDRHRRRCSPGRGANGRGRPPLFAGARGVAEDLAFQFKVPPAEVPGRVQALIAERKALEKALADAKRKLALGGSGGAAPAEEAINGVKFIGRVLEGVDGKGLRPVIEDFRKQIGSGVVAVIGVTEGKAAVAIAVTPDLTDRFSASDLIKLAVPAMGGQGGGGKPDFAQGGAPDGSLAEAGLAAVRAALG